MTKKMSDELQVKIDRMGRIQVPKPIRDKLDLYTNEWLDAEVGPDYLLVKKKVMKPSDPRRTIEFRFDDLRKSRIDKRKKTFQPGTYVKCLSMEADENPIPQDMVGIVRGVDDIGSVHIDWINGRRVASLDIPGDALEVISEKEYKRYKS